MLLMPSGKSKPSDDTGIFLISFVEEKTEISKVERVLKNMDGRGDADNAMPVARARGER